ncbi:hypothetical protein SLG_03380 [Sphingobium sp. SYK-6]|nr:hypothetical protein SLG_03380 [Sphingobium sp. SYK-6]
MGRMLLLLIAMLVMPAAAQAKWLEASSAHFVIYANDTEEELRQFSDQLERYHSGMAFLLNAGKEPPSPSNRVTIFVVKNEREVRKLARDNSGFVYAFYKPRAGASIAVTPRVNTGTGRLDFSMIALLHEYTHHFLYSIAQFPWPLWFMEGSAEFFASAQFSRDGTVMLGMPARHRAAELFYVPDVTARDLLDPESYEKKKNRRGYDAYYGKSWLLYHYLSLEKSRSGQLKKYLSLLQSGKRSVDAAQEAFGDLDVLERYVEQYMKRPRLSYIHLSPALIQASPVALRELGDGEAAIMPIRIRSQLGVTEEEAGQMFTESKAIAARYPGDAAVLTALAEAAHDAGDDDAAIRAADAALAIDPRQVNAYVQKGLSLFRKAEKAEDPEAAYRAARAPFLALNKLENDHPLPLVYYYLAFVGQGVTPTDTAVQALQRAVELAPFDLGLRQQLAFQQIRDKHYDEAVVTLGPVAYNPHGGSGSAFARRVIDRLNSGENLEDFDPSSLEEDSPADEGAASRPEE